MRALGTTLLATVLASCTALPAPETARPPPKDLQFIIDHLVERGEYSVRGSCRSYVISVSYTDKMDGIPAIQQYDFEYLNCDPRERRGREDTVTMRSILYAGSYVTGLVVKDGGADGIDDEDTIVWVDMDFEAQDGQISVFTHGQEPEQPVYDLTLQRIADAVRAQRPAQ